MRVLENTLGQDQCLKKKGLFQGKLLHSTIISGRNWRYWLLLQTRDALRKATWAMLLRVQASLGVPSSLGACFRTSRTTPVSQCLGCKWSEGPLLGLPQGLTKLGLCGPARLQAHSQDSAGFYCTEMRNVIILENNLQCTFHCFCLLMLLFQFFKMMYS